MTRTLNLVAFVVFACALFIRSTDPVVPQIAAGLNVEPATAALLSTAFTLPYALVQPVLGALADMFSKARLMLLCLFVVTAATLACGFAPNFPLLAAGRVLAGLAAGGVVPIAFALVGDNIPVHERQVAMGRLLFAIMTGNLLGATCAGVIGDLAGWRGVFFVTGALGLIAVLAAMPGLRGTSDAAGHADLSKLMPNYRAILRNPAGQDLLRHGVSGSRAHVRLLSLHRRPCCTRPARPGPPSPASCSPASVSAARFMARWCRGCCRGSARGA